MSRVIGTRTTNEPIFDDSTPFQATDTTQTIYYMRFEDNDTDKIYLQKVDNTDGTKIYHAIDTWAKRTTTTYTAINY